MELGLPFADEQCGDEHNSSSNSSRKSCQVLPAEYVAKHEPAGWFLLAEPATAEAEDETDTDCGIRRSVFHYLQKSGGCERSLEELKLLLLRQRGAAGGGRLSKAVHRQLLDASVRCHVQLQLWQPIAELLATHRQLVANRQQLFCWLQLVMHVLTAAGDCSGGGECEGETVWQTVYSAIEHSLGVPPLHLAHWLIELDKQNPLSWHSLALIYLRLHVRHNCRTHPIDHHSAGSCSVSLRHSSDTLRVTPSSADGDTVTGAPLSADCWCVRYSLLAQLHCCVCWQLVQQPAPAVAACGDFLTAVVRRNLTALTASLHRVPEEWWPLARHALTVHTAQLPTGDDQSEPGRFGAGGGDSSRRHLAPTESVGECPSRGQFEQRWFRLFGGSCAAPPPDSAATVHCMTPTQSMTI